MNGRYVLKGKEVVKCEDLLVWAKEMSKIRRVARTKVGDVDISTVFLGLDHRFSGEGDPIVFETMIFGNPDFEGYQERYHTWEEAEVGHQLAVTMVQEHKL